MQRILVIEDSLPSQRVVAAALTSPDIQIVCTASLVETAQLTIHDTNFSLIILDLVLPDGDGLGLMRAWYSSGMFRGVPVILLSGREDVEAKVAAFALGAEDYIVKPVNPRELRARVDLRLRRASESRTSTEVLKRGSLILNFPLMRATLVEDGREILVDFTAKEFRLVATLASNEGQVFSRPQLVNKIWGKDMHVVNRTVDSHICGARRKLGVAGEYIQSVNGSGYRFIVRDQAKR